MHADSGLSPVIYGFSGTRLTKAEEAFFTAARPYGFILFARNCEHPAQVKELTAALRKLAGRETLPILIDQEGGRVARLKPPHWPQFPPAGMFAALAESHLQKAKQAVYLNARLIAAELHVLGITVDCAPLADIPVAGAHDIIGDRAFGNTPQQVATLARAMADGLMDGGIVPVLKHIPGHGRAGADSHEELPVVHTAKAELDKTDFAPFRQLADLPMGMTAHVLYTALDKEHMATVSPRVIQLIRNEIGFDGLLMSDDVSMKAMRGDFSQRAQEVLAAGCDIVLHCNGSMEEMQQVAKGVGRLAGKPLARATLAMQSAAAPKAMDMAAARQELQSLLAA